MISALKPPTTYAEWISLFDKLKNREDDQSVLEAMLSGSIQWQTGVAERFSKKLIDAINYRMNTSIDRFQKEIGRSCGQERELVNSLLVLRKEFCYLSTVINLPALPEKDRTIYLQLVIDQANKIQKSLEDTSKADRTGRLSSIIKNNRVNAI